MRTKKKLLRLEKLQITNLKNPDRIKGGGNDGTGGTDTGVSAHVKICVGKSQGDASPGGGNAGIPGGGC